MSDVTAPLLSAIEIDRALRHARTCLLNQQISRPWIAWELTPLRCTVKSQVFLARWEKQFLVVKQFTNDDDYVRELFALTLLENYAPVVRLVEAVDNCQLLVLEYLPYPYPYNNVDGLLAIAYALGTLHTVSSRWDSGRCEVTSEFRLAELVKGKLVPGLNIWDARAWEELLDLLLEVAGPDIVPLALIDLKGEHLRTHSPGGAPFFLDFETLDFGIPGFVDFLALPWVSGTEHIPEDLRERLLAAYAASLRRSGQNWTRSKLRKALTLTCSSLHLTPQGWGSWLFTPDTEQNSKEE